MRKKVDLESQKEYVRQSLVSGKTMCDIARDVDTTPATLRARVGEWGFWQFVPKQLKRPRQSLRLEDYLVKHGPVISAYRLKQRLIEAGLKQDACEVCGISEWCDQPAPIQLDHIDGDRYNNELSNLQTICANCHAQTPTFAGRNIEVVKYDGPVTKSERKCLRCETYVSSTRRVCDSCKKPGLAWPSREEVAAMVAASPVTTVAKQLGVSDVAVHKFCQRNGIDKRKR